jgi:hypothetical protein
MLLRGPGMTVTRGGGPRRQRHKKEEGRSSQGEVACGFGWAGPLRLAGEKLGARAAEAKWASGL